MASLFLVSDPGGGAAFPLLLAMDVHHRLAENVVCQNASLIGRVWPRYNQPWNDSSLTLGEGRKRALIDS